MAEEFLVTMCEKTEGFGIKSITHSIPKDAYVGISMFLMGKASIVPNEEPKKESSEAQIEEVKQ